MSYLTGNGIGNIQPGQISSGIIITMLGSVTKCLFPITKVPFVNNRDGINTPALGFVKHEAIHRRFHRFATRINRDHGIKSENIILAGFSQGGAIALHTALRYQKPLAGIMGLSTYLPLADTLEDEINNANKNTPVFLAHGRHDAVIPLQLASDTQTALNKLGYTVELKKYEMEHSVCPEEIDNISDWINRCFA